MCVCILLFPIPLPSRTASEFPHPLTYRKNSDKSPAPYWVSVTLAPELYYIRLALAWHLNVTSYIHTRALPIHASMLILFRLSTMNLTNVQDPHVGHDNISDALPGQTIY